MQKAVRPGWESSEHSRESILSSASGFTRHRLRYFATWIFLTPYRFRLSTNAIKDAAINTNLKFYAIWPLALLLSVDPPKHDLRTWVDTLNKFYSQFKSRQANSFCKYLYSANKRCSYFQIVITWIQRLNSSLSQRLRDWSLLEVT